MESKVIKQILEWNEDLANEIKEILKKKKVYLINVMGSSGAGKTSLIIELIKKLKDKYSIAVIEGDIVGKIDAEAIDPMGFPVIQLNIGNSCHIEAISIKKIIQYFDLDELDIIFIENIGNLVCNNDFKLGEDFKISILSIPEGDDKIQKYPSLFSNADAVVLNKYDMIKHFSFDDKRVEEDLKKLNPETNIFKVASLIGYGMISLASIIEQKVKNKKDAV